MRMCAELAELGMDLARVVAARALADWAKPEEPPAAPQPFEPEAEHPTLPPQAARPLRLPGLSVRAASCKSADPALIFTRVAACVRASVTLESRLAAGLTPTSRATSPTLRADPRRAPLRDIFRKITQHHPDHADLVRETTARIDADLAADPEHTLELPELFFNICEDLGIEVDLAHLPDAFLGLAADDEAPPNSPTPRATSPP